jgi:hypothetical protein
MGVLEDVSSWWRGLPVKCGTLRIHNVKSGRVKCGTPTHCNARGWGYVWYYLNLSGLDTNREILGKVM